ncbi:hypothetical protein QYE76_026822 [Lolium multiflorum]|uniref:Poly [ADP-ribose] polymerase n=1 Tax=Lolium multiflorum TaxID=4521 RepID=A0AAD8VXZ4_LOLMU|nr:hypothetical protein QYE76_026822 [Lolium multiflorum]
MAAHLNALLRAKLRCRLALHANAHCIAPGRSLPLPPPHHHQADFLLRAPLAVPARWLAARPSRKKKDAAAMPLSTPNAGAAAKGGADGKAQDAAAAAAAAAVKKDAKIVTATKKGAAVLDPHIPDDMMKSWHVLQAGDEIYDATLNQTNVGANNNKFFIIQALESDVGKSFMVYWRYGRVGSRGRTELMGPMQRHEAINLFKFKFEDKTNNQWVSRHSFRCHAKKYTWLEMDYGKEGDKAQKKELVANQIKETKLETRTAQFISVICDITMMKQQMMEIGYDADKLPLGKISQSTISKGYDVLKRISHAISRGDKIHIEQLTGEFYTIIPHDFGFKKMREFIIDTPEKLKAKLEMDDPLYARYKQLGCDFTPLEVDTEEYSMIKTYLKNTHGKNHLDYTVDIVQIFKVTRQGETERFQKFIGAGNRMLLWHGSRLTNWTGIFSKGLRIAPPEAPNNGYMFGKGVYLADMFSKSANYCCFSETSNKSGVLLLCEVSLGSMNELINGDVCANNLPKGKLSTKGLGKMAPDMANSKITDDGVVVPLGKPIKVSPGKGILNYNEYIVYDVNQIRMRYVIHVSFNSKKK